MRQASPLRAVQLVAEGRLAVVDLGDPGPPGPGQVRVGVRYLALNHLDLFSFRGMAFGRRKLPLVVGVEAAGIVASVGEGVESPVAGEPVVIYPGLFCGRCDACLDGRENLCDEPGGILGFHLDGLAAEYVVVPQRLLVSVPEGVPLMQAACAPITMGTVEHMLFDNARLLKGETILVHAGAGGIGSAAVLLAKQAGATVFATVGSEKKAAAVRRLGADEVIDYSRESFSRRVRRLTAKRGVDVVFEHVGAETWQQSLHCLTRGGRLVICGSTTGVSAPTNLYALFNQQIRIFGSFGGSLRNVQEGLQKMARGDVRLVVEALGSLDRLETGVERLRDRDVFGKLVAEVA